MKEFKAPRDMESAHTGNSAASVNSLTNLGLDASVRSFPDCFPQYNPVDIYKSFIASKLSAIADVDATLIYDSLQWTASLDHGDLNLPVPRLRIKGAPPAQLATQWAEHVCP